MFIIRHLVLSAQIILSVAALFPRGLSGRGEVEALY
jgi:hypothetical protein